MMKAVRTARTIVLEARVKPFISLRCNEFSMKVNRNPGFSILTYDWTTLLKKEPEIYLKKIFKTIVLDHQQDDDWIVSCNHNTADNKTKCQICSQNGGALLRS